MTLKRIIPLFSALLLFVHLWTQGLAQTATTLVAGDIVVIGMSGDTTPSGTGTGKSFTFVPLVDLGEGTIINFTDSGWLGSSFRPNEGGAIYTAPEGGIPAGTVISASGDSNATWAANGSEWTAPPVGVGSNGMNFSTSGDQVLVYTGDAISPTFIFALNGASTIFSLPANANDSNRTALPTGLVDGTNAVAAGSGSGDEDEYDNVYYSGITNGTREEILAAVADAASWTGNNSSYSPYSINFTISGGGDVAPTVNSTIPTGNATNIAVDSTITINFSESVIATVNAFSLECPSGTPVSFSTDIALPSSSFTLTPDSDLPNSETCEVTVTAAEISDQDAPIDYMAVDYTFSFTTENPSGAIYIHDIQGSGNSVAITGQVTIEGVVVGDYQDSTEWSGFILQEEDADADANMTTSEGIFVYCGLCTTAVSEGQIVSVTGTAEEYFNNSQIGADTASDIISITDAGNNMALVTPVTLSMPFPADVGGVPYLETIENMRVVVPAGLVATELYNLGRGGAIMLSSGDRLYQPTEIALPDDTVAVSAIADFNRRNQIVIDDSKREENPATVIHPAPGLSLANRVRSGDTLAADFVGVLTYNYYGWSGSDNAYRVHPTNGGATFNSVNPRTTSPPSVGAADIKVASFNVLNYFNGNGSGGGFPAPRGANTYSEFTRQHAKIVAAIIALDADIIGLMEIENDGYGSTSAIQDLVDGLNAATALGTYAFVDPGVAQIGTDEIAVGLLYKPNSVSISGAAQILDDSDDPNFNTDKNRPALAQTFTYDVDPTQALTIVVNHLKSKGSDCDALGDPDTEDGQGECNLTRTAAATAEATWLGTDPTGSGDTDFLVIGDLNAYSMEDPIMAFADGGFVNLTVGFESKYSYVYKGQFGHLDHALATPSLVSQITGTAVWHINSDEPPAFDYNDYNQATLYAPDAYRASDHDPVIIGIDFDQQSDFSDATSSYGLAWHTGTGAVRLGTEWTADTGFNVTPDVGDDGVTIGAGTGSGGQWQPGTDGASLSINVTGGTGCLYTWVDWNGDGVFDASDDPENLEYAIRSVVAGPGIGNYAFDVPANQFQTPPGDNTPLQTYNVRVRLYGSCSSGPTGAAVNGEVEDYIFTFTPTAVNLQSFNTTNQNTLWLAILLVIVTLLAGSSLMWLNGRSRRKN